MVRKALKKVVFCVLAVAVVPILACAETWKGMPMVDSMCFEKVKADPDAHSTKCAIACAKNGYGIIDAHGAFLKFDESGNEKIAALLKNTKEKDHLRVTVDGDRSGNTIKVKSVSLN